MAIKEINMQQGKGECVCMDNFKDRSNQVNSESNTLF